MPTLKDGSQVSDPRLDRIYEEDWRSLNFLVTAALPEDHRTPLSVLWHLLDFLDQGLEGACVGFGFGHDLLATPVVVSGVDNRYAREVIYWTTQRNDYWPGGAYPGADPFYEGTSVLSGAKTLQDLGFYTSYDWGITTRDVVLGIGYTGPSILGLNWYEGMFETDANGWIRPTGAQAGGHCILAIGVQIVWKTGSTTRTWEDVDLDQSYLILHNSWGPNWGVNGRAKLSLRDFDRLLNEQGDAVFPRRNPDILNINGETVIYTDIANTPHKAAIEWAAENGIVTGFSDGSFRPNEPVTRGQMATMLKRYHDGIGSA